MRHGAWQPHRHLFFDSSTGPGEPSQGARYSLPTSAASGSPWIDLHWRHSSVPWRALPRHWLVPAGTRSVLESYEEGHRMPSTTIIDLTTPGRRPLWTGYTVLRPGADVPASLTTSAFALCATRWTILATRRQHSVVDAYAAAGATTTRRTPNHLIVNGRHPTRWCAPSWWRRKGFHQRPSYPERHPGGLTRPGRRAALAGIACAVPSQRSQAWPRSQVGGLAR